MAPENLLSTKGQWAYIDGEWYLLDDCLPTITLAKDDPATDPEMGVGWASWNEGLR